MRRPSRAEGVEQRQQQRAAVAAPAGARRDRELGDVADAVVPALAERGARQALVVLEQQPQRRVPALLLDPLGRHTSSGSATLPSTSRKASWTSACTAISSRSRSNVRSGPGRRRRQRPRARSACGSSAAPASSPRPAAARAAASLPTAMTGAARAVPRSRAARLGELAQRVPMPRPAASGCTKTSASSPGSSARGDDLAAGVLDDPGVAREVEPGRRPVGPQVLEREVGGADVGDVARDDHVEHGGGVGVARRAHRGGQLRNLPQVARCVSGSGPACRRAAGTGCASRRPGARPAAARAARSDARRRRDRVAGARPLGVQRLLDLARHRLGRAAEPGQRPGS